MQTILKSEITCPNCGHKKIEEMPTNACQFFYECDNCQKVLKPKEGDCCVYCSYGTVPCPPIQENKSCCQSEENMKKKEIKFKRYKIKFKRATQSG